MDAHEAAQATATAVSTIGSRFMLDGPTYVTGAGLGFQGLDFYAAGRGGALGDVDADVVAAAFAFFEPAYVRSQWELGAKVMPVREAATAFSGCCAAWAEAHVPDDLDAARLAELAGRVVAEGRSSCAPLFAAWRAMPVPTAPKAAAVHQMNVIRELRNGLHAACVLAAGLAPLEAMCLRSPGMVPMFGWATTADVKGLQPRWDDAERATDVAMAHAYAGLPEAERDELVSLANALHAATS